MESNPYAPSAASLNISPEATLQSAGSEFRDLSALTGAVSMLLLAGAGWEILHLGSLFMQLHLISHGPVVIVLWWILWVTRLLGNAVLQSSLRSHSLSQLQDLTLWEIVTDTLSVPLYVLAWYIVRRVWRDQSENGKQAGHLSLA